MNIKYIFIVCLLMILSGCVTEYDFTENQFGEEEETENNLDEDESFSFILEKNYENLIYSSKEKSNECEIYKSGQI